MDHLQQYCSENRFPAVLSALDPSSESHLPEPPVSSNSNAAAATVSDECRDSVCSWAPGGSSCPSSSDTASIPSGSLRGYPPAAEIEARDIRRAQKRLRRDSDASSDASIDSEVRDPTFQHPDSSFDSATSEADKPEESHIVTSEQSSDPNRPAATNTAGEAVPHQVARVVSEIVDSVHGKTGDKTNWREMKQLKRQGLAYTNRAGNKVGPRGVKPYVCPKACPFSCNSNIGSDQRERIFSAYMHPDTDQHQLICSLVETGDVRYRATDSTSRKSKTHRYFLIIDNQGTRRQVCRMFFLKTLDVGEKFVRISISNRKPGGAHVKPVRKLPDVKHALTAAQTDLVHRHIKSFPMVPSHYCRKSTKNIYIESFVRNKSNMYRLYRDFCGEQEGSPIPVSISSYKRILRSDFPRLRIFKPKKDQCVTCAKFRNLKGQDKAEFEPRYNQHIAMKNAARTEKNDDMEKAKGSSSFASITCDLQAVLYVPTSEVSLLFYKRKLSTYNFTVCNQKQGHCYYWNETEGNRGAQEIASCLADYLLGLPEQVRHVVVWSDCCAGQNRNQFVAAAMHYVVNHQKGPERIEHKFLESGHTYMECDSMHSNIETAARGIEVNIPAEWVNVLKMARPSQRFDVKTMRFGDFKDFKGYAGVIFCNKRPGIPWTKLKVLSFSKATSSILYRMDFSSQFSEFRLPEQPATRKRSLGSHQLVQAYDQRLPISRPKKADLMALCNAGAIPQDYWFFYEALRAVDDDNSDNTGDAESDFSNDDSGSEDTISDSGELDDYSDEN